MNPLTNMKNVTKLSERELHNNSKSSWHDQYRDSAWIFIGGLPYDLTEGDIICIFSQYGEIVNINLIRDKDNGKSKGFCFLCYEDQRSTVLAVDNLNGIKVLTRILRVDHVSEYKVPKEGKQTSEETKKLYNEGCAPKAFVPVVKNPLMENPEYRRETLADQIQADIRLPARLPIRIEVKKEIDSDGPITVKTEKKKKKKSKKHSTSEDSSDSDSRKNNKKNRRHKRFNSISESESENGKKRDRSQSEERKIRHKRSISEEQSGKSTDRFKKNMKRERSRSQSYDKKKKRRSRSRSVERKSRRSLSRDESDRGSRRLSKSYKSKRDKYRRSRS
ncbi:U2 snRNP component ist3-like [Harmonia axyridis]|uniref:U2 snRNP component ist3-like n=1 Tax=Harmonia axyridis TaxID=115357 RepID=UPI001E2782A5|nr:U2 snRNP component ist3-like [Harmonia axyridis]